MYVLLVLLYGTLKLYLTFYESYSSSILLQKVRRLLELIDWFHYLLCTAPFAVSWWRKEVATHYGEDAQRNGRLFAGCGRKRGRPANSGGNLPNELFLALAPLLLVLDWACIWFDSSFIEFEFQNVLSSVLSCLFLRVLLTRQKSNLKLLKHYQHQHITLHLECYYALHWSILLLVTIAMLLRLAWRSNAGQCPSCKISTSKRN